MSETAENNIALRQEQTLDRQEGSQKASTADHVCNQPQKEDLECQIQGHAQGQVRKSLPILQDNWSTLRRTTQQRLTHRYTAHLKSETDQVNPRSTEIYES